MFDEYGQAVLSLLWAVLRAARSLFRTQRELALENLALRQQVAVLLGTSRGRRLRLGALDRASWVILSERWAGRRDALAIAEPATIVRWHPAGIQAILAGPGAQAVTGWTARSWD